MRISEVSSGPSSNAVLAARPTARLIWEIGYGEDEREARVRLEADADVLEVLAEQRSYMRFRCSVLLPLLERRTGVTLT